jgi:hypothetical protein
MSCVRPVDPAAYNQRRLAGSVRSAIVRVHLKASVPLDEIAFCPGNAGSATDPLGLEEEGAELRVTSTRPAFYAGESAPGGGTTHATRPGTADRFCVA